MWTTVRDVGQLRGGIQRAPERRRGRFMTKYLRAANVTIDGLDLTDIAEMDISPQELAVCSLEPGDVLVVEGSGSARQVGRAAIWRGDIKPCSFQNHLIRFRSHAVIPGYALTVFHYFAEAGVFSRVARGVGIQHLGLSRFAAMPFPLAPLSEQERIVGEVERRKGLAKQAEESLLSALARVDQQVSAILEAAAFGDLLQPDDQAQQRNLISESSSHASSTRRDHSQRVSPGCSNESWANKLLPSGWSWAKVGEVGEAKLGRQRSPKHQRGPHMCAYLRVANVFEDHIDGTDLLRMNFSPAEQRIYCLRPSDILLNEGQSPELVGRPAMYWGTPPEVCFQNTLIRFRPSERLDPDFALLVFRHYFRSGKFTAVARWSTNIAHLGVKRFMELPFPLPTREDQRKLVQEAKRRLEASEAQRLAAQAALDRLQPLRLELLTAAVSGRLVSQSPHEEPASRLVARLGIPVESVPPTPYPSSKDLQMGNDLSAAVPQRPLPDVLDNLGGRASAEQLFEACGYDRNSTEDVEAFYLVLREHLGKRIRSVAGPNRSLMLEAASDAPR
ncbi:MAG: hypothetical protein Q8Q12_12380 [bacterium]|nr:hypothetical protein [bacterium]